MSICGGSPRADRAWPPARPGAGRQGLRLPRKPYDKLAVRYEATVCIAAINEWLLPPFMKHALGQPIWCRTPALMIMRPPATPLASHMLRRTAGIEYASPMPIASPTPAWSALDSVCSKAER